MPASGTPGLSYAIVEGDTIATHARGVAEAGSDEKVTADTPFLLGSISKSFTSLAVMQLVEAHEVELNAPVSRYLEDFADQPGGAITLRQLLSHTSGFSTRQGNVAYDPGSETADELAQRVQRLAAEAPAYPPGTRWEYSNRNYQILGRVIEVVSGQDYQGYVTTHILQPLDMTDSFVADGAAHSAMASGHSPWFWTKRALVGENPGRSSAPQGGIVASARDVARYLQAMMNGRDDIVTAASKAEMMRPASAISPFYGLGWFVDTGQHTVWHSGSSPGFETLATMVPSEQRAAVVLVNAGSGIGFGETAALRNGITARALGLPYDGEGTRVPQKALFVAVAILPLFYLLAIAWAWRHRDALRAKVASGPFGRFSLWFPLLTTIGIVVLVFALLPVVAGLTLQTLRRYQPDFALMLIGSALAGVAWALFRLGLAYSGRRDAA